MKKLILLLTMISTIALAQAPDTLTPEKNARWKINRIRDNRIRVITPTDFRNAFNSVANLAVKRVPYLTVSELRAGKADTARVISVQMGKLSGTYVYDPVDSTSTDDSVSIFRVAGRAYKLQIDGALSANLLGVKADSVTNDLVAFEKAIRVANKLKVPLTWDGVVYLNTESRSEKRVLLPDGLTLSGKGVGKSKIRLSFSAKLVPRNYTVISNIRFYGSNSVEAIKTYDEQVTTGWRIVSCDFTGTLQKGIHINAALPNSYHTDAAVTGNTFSGIEYPVLVIRGEGIEIARNVITNIDPTHRGITLFGGKSLDIHSNIIRNGKTGISFLYQRSTAGSKGIVNGNRIHHNQIYGIIEESISFDSRVNEPTQMAPRETFAITSKSISGPTYRIHAPGDWSGGFSQLDYYACFVTGKMKGQIARITAHTAGTAIFSLDIGAERYAKISVADSVVIGSPFFNNTISDNYVEGPSQTVGIYLFGMCYNNVIENNVVKYTGTGTQLMPVIPLAGIAVTSVIGIDPTGSITGKRIAPSENNRIVNNVVENNDIHATFTKFGSFQFPVKGNEISGNVTTKRIRLDYNEDLTKGNMAAFGTVKTATFASVDSTSEILVNKSITGLKGSFSDSVTVTGPATFQRAGEQLRIGYDASSYVSFTTSSGGGLSISPSGGMVSMLGRVIMGTDSSNIWVPSTRGVVGTNKSGFPFAGASFVELRAAIRSNLNPAITTTRSYSTFLIGTNQVTVAGSGTHNLFAQQVIKPLSITAGAGTVTNSATLYLENAATGATNNYSLFVDAGDTRLDGGLILTSVPVYEDNAAALAAGKAVGTVYRNSTGHLMIVY